MDLEDLQKELADLEAKRAKLVAMGTQLDGAIGFCKELIKKASPVNRLEPSANGDPKLETVG